MLGFLTAIVADEHSNGKYPWWVRATQAVGIPAVGFAVLLWWMLTSLDARLNAMAIQQEAMFRLQQQICVNTSATPEQRNACWNPWR